MAVLTTDSPLSRLIVRAFLDFLDSVEPAPGLDLEGLEVARECLVEAFKLDSPSSSDEDQPPPQPGLLLQLFRSLQTNRRDNDRSNQTHPPASHSCAENAACPETTTLQADDWRMEPNSTGLSKDELFGQFFAALEKIHFFKTTTDGHDDPVQLDRVTHLFHNALNEMERNGCQSYNQKSLAETLKSQGNRALQSKLYYDAIELYSCAISLCGNNAVYYCNRAAAYTHIHKYDEAISDCLKSIEIDPKYSKAYSRLGLGYYAKGNYRDAIDKGFKKALQLDPSNESVKENFRVAEQKLKEELQRSGWDQNPGSSCCDDQEFNSQSSEGSRSHSRQVPSDSNAIPADFASMLMNLATNAFSQDRQGDNRNSTGSNVPEIRVGGNPGANLAENVPEELRGALRSVMEMFSGAAHLGNPPQGTANGGSPTR